MRPARGWRIGREVRRRRSRARLRPIRPWPANPHPHSVPNTEPTATPRPAGADPQPQTASSGRGARPPSHHSPADRQPPPAGWRSGGRGGGAPDRQPTAAGRVAERWPWRRGARPTADRRRPGGGAVAVAAGRQTDSRPPPAGWRSGGRGGGAPDRQPTAAGRVAERWPWRRAGGRGATPPHPPARNHEAVR